MLLERFRRDDVGGSVAWFFLDALAGFAIGRLFARHAGEGGAAELTVVRIHGFHQGLFLAVESCSAACWKACWMAS